MTEIEKLAVCTKCGLYQWLEGKEAQPQKCLCKNTSFKFFFQVFPGGKK